MSWNDKLENEELCHQISMMNDVGIGGYFMHARGGLITEYMGKEWFDAVDALSGTRKSRWHEQLGV